THPSSLFFFVFFFQAEDGIRDFHVTGVQTCALPILSARDLNESPEFAGPEYQTMRIFAAMIGGAGPAYEMPYAVELEGVGPGYRSEERRVGKECRSRGSAER